MTSTSTKDTLIYKISRFRKNGTNKEIVEKIAPLNTEFWGVSDENIKQGIDYIYGLDDNAFNELVNKMEGELPKVGSVENILEVFWDKDLAGIDIKKEWVVDGYILNRCLGMLQGNPSSSKTILSLHMAVCVASGKPFLGIFPVKQGCVLYIDSDNRIEGLKEKSEAIKEGMGLSGTQLPIAYYPHEFILTEESDYSKLKTFIEKYKPVLIIIDILSDMISIEENKAEEWVGLFRDYLSPLRVDNDCSILFLHHLRKPNPAVGKKVFSPAGETRGSSMIRAKLDIMLTTTADYSEDNVFILSQEKIKSAQMKQPIRYLLTWEKDDKTDVAKSVEINYLGELESSMSKLIKCTQELEDWFSQQRGISISRKLIIEEFGARGYSWHDCDISLNGHKFKKFQGLVSRGIITKPSRGKYMMPKEGKEFTPTNLKNF